MATFVSILPVLKLPWELARDYVQLNFTGLQNTINQLISDNGLDTLNLAWVDVAFAASNFSSNGLGSITASASEPYAMTYRVIGKLMWLNCTVSVKINNTATNEIRVKIPGGYTLRSNPGVGALTDGRHRTGAVWTDSTANTSGVAMASLNVSGNYVAVNRYDGTPLANWTNGDTVVVGFMVVCPLA